MNMYSELEAAPAMTFSWGCQARCSSLLWKSAVWASMPASGPLATLARLVDTCREMPKRCAGCEACLGSVYGIGAQLAVQAHSGQMTLACLHTEAQPMACRAACRGQSCTCSAPCQTASLLQLLHAYMPDAGWLPGGLTLTVCSRLRRGSLEASSMMSGVRPSRPITLNRLL